MTSKKSVVHEATGVNVEILFKDAISLDIDLHQYSSNELARRITEINRHEVTPYPTKTAFTSCNIYKDGKVLGLEVSMKQADEIMKANNKAVVERVFNEDAYKQALKAHNEHQALLRQVFVWGLFYLEDVMDNPKANKAFNLAWEYGHSAGYTEVQCYFDDLVELIK